MQPMGEATTQDKSIDVLMTLIGEYWGEIHHIEDQRSALTNILLVIESAAVALVVQSGYSKASLPLPILLTLVGGIGILATRKYHERFRYAQERLTQWYRTVDKLCPEACLMESLRKANESHRGDVRLLLFKRFHLKEVPLHNFWIWIHVLFVLTGVALAAVILK
ncbi:MAG: hypothetical protein ABUT39_09140 [Acidobacteriota bacterium]